MTMMIHGLLVMAIEENGSHGYVVRDCNRRLGAILRHNMPIDPYPATKRVFVCFGEYFDKLSDAVSEFLKIKGCRPRNAVGDCDE